MCKCQVTIFHFGSCHLKRITNEYIMKLSQYDETNNIYTKIIFAVCVHTKAIKLVVCAMILFSHYTRRRINTVDLSRYLQIMWEPFETYYFWTIFCGISTGSMAVVTVSNVQPSLQSNLSRRILLWTWP